MSRFYFHIRTANGLLLEDPEGEALPGADEAIQHALESASEVSNALRGAWKKAKFEIVDDMGGVVRTVPLVAQAA